MKQLLILLVACFTATAAFTHPGATDKNGWHTDSKTGKRHQHPKPAAKKDEAKKPEPKKNAPKKTAPTKKK
jgi:hypothetical protein